MPVFKINPALGDAKVFIRLRDEPKTPQLSEFVTTRRIGPISITQRVVGVLEPGQSLTFKHGGADLIGDENGTDARLGEDQKVEVFDWHEEFGSPHGKVIREVPVEKINDDPELRRFLHHSPERG